MENQRRSFSSKINFNLPTIKLPESTLKNISVALSLGAQHSKLFDSLKPVLAVRDAWKQFGVINSDIFKMHAANQTQFAKLSAQLTKNLDFGFSESLSKITQQVAAQQASWLRTLGPTLQKLKASFYPPNLRAIEGMYFEDVEKVVMADGIALYGVPRTAIAEALIRADSAAKRREIVGRRWKGPSRLTVALRCSLASRILLPPTSPSPWPRLMRSTAVTPQPLKRWWAHSSTVS